RFAELLIDPGIADLVLGTDKKFRFEIRGRWLLSATERVPAELALPMMKLNQEFIRRVFDFTYFIEKSDFDDDAWGDWEEASGERLKLNSESKRYYRFSCCVTEMRTAWPHLIIDPQTFGRRILNRLGLPDIDVESEAFNRSYAVTCEDRRFAELLIDPGIADLVLGTDKKFRFE
ncbi:MAG: hypothetical protein AAGK32_22640, partial [Actinomycetota bacterium]